MNIEFCVVLMRHLLIALIAALSPSVFAFDLCHEKDNPAFQEALNANQDLARETAAQLTEKYILAIAKESKNLDQNIRIGNVALDAVTFKMSRQVKNGMSASTVLQEEANALRLGLTKMGSSAERYKAFLGKVTPMAESVGRAALVAGVVMDSVKAACTFHSMYSTDNYEPMKALADGGVAISSSLSVIVAGGSLITAAGGSAAAEGAVAVIPGPWSIVLLGVAADIAMIQADLDVADQINTSLTDRVNALNDRYIAFIGRAKRQAGKTINLPADVLNGIVMDASATISEAKALQNEIGEVGNILMPLGLKKSLRDSLDNLIRLLSLPAFSQSVTNSFAHSRQEILTRASQKRPDVIEIESKNYPLTSNSIVAVHMLSPDMTLRPGGMLTVSAEVSKTNGAAPVLYVRDPSGKDIAGALFTTKISAINGVERWQYQKAITNLTPGAYTLVAKATGAGNKIVESASIRLQVEEASVTGSITSPLNQSVAVGGTVTLSGTASGADSLEVRVIWTDPASGQQLSEKAVYDKSSGTWTLPRTFNVAGKYAYRTEIFANGSAVPFGSPGSVEVTAASAGAPAGTVTSAGASVLRPGALLALSGSSQRAKGIRLVFTKPSASEEPAGTFDSSNGRWALAKKLQAEGKYEYKLVAVGTPDTIFYSGTVEVKGDAVTDDMSFVSDSPADDTVFTGGASFVKSWTLKNTGSRPWGSSNCLRPRSGTALGSQTVCVSGTVAPGATYVFKAPMVAPAEQAASTTYRQDWGLFGANGELIGSSVFARIVVKGKATAVKVESLEIPASVRVSTESWHGTLGLSGPASSVQMKLTDAQGRSTTLGWSPVSTTQYSLQHTFATAGAYTWQLVVTSATGTETRSGAVNVLGTVGVGGGASASFQTNSQVKVGEAWRLDVTTSKPAASVFLQFGNAAGIRLTKLSDTKFTYSRTFSTPGQYAFNVKTQFQKSSGVTSPGSVQVVSRLIDPPSTLVPEPVEPLNPVLTKTDTVEAFSAWSASLRTDAPVDSADLVFKNGRRIPFDGRATQWATRAENSKFSDPGAYDYELKLRRTSSSELETFAGGTLVVSPRPVQAVLPVITSSLTVGQGSPYSLTVTTSAHSDKVTVSWPDSGEQQLKSLDANQTQWEFDKRVFNGLLPQAFVVRTYKDGISAPTGEVRGTLNVTPAAANMRLLEVSKNIIKGEVPLFKVEASLAIKRASIKLGSDSAVELADAGIGGTNQYFAGSVPARQSGPAVPYAITGYNAQGQVSGNVLTGTVSVADAGDSLKGLSPVPAELVRGQSVHWQFLTNQQPEEMWLEFTGAIGRQALTGTYFDHTFNYPAGDYSYRLMRKDHLNNVFAIQGASGVLRIKEGQVSTQYVSASANGQAIAEGAVLHFSTGELIQLSVRTNQAIPRLFVLLNELNWDRDFTSSDKMQWSAGMAGLARGTYKAQMYVKDLSYQRLSVPAPVNFTIQIQDGLPKPVISGVQPQGALMVNTPATVFFNGQNLTPDVLVTVSNCDQPQTQLVNPTQIRHQCVPRQAGQQNAGWKANASAALVNAGSVTVAPAASLPATITSVQPQGSPTVNTPATVLFNGQNLTPDVLVTVSNCDQPQTQLVNPTQIRHQCVPRQAGQQNAGWKANASAALVTAGSVTVAPAASLPATITSVQPQGSPTVNTPATVLFNGQNLTPDVLVTVSNCDQPQTQLVNPTQIRHQCVPRQAGQQNAGWKANASAALVTAGSVTVAPAALSIQILSPDIALGAGDTLTVLAEVNGTSVLAPMLHVLNQSGGLVAGAQFNIRVPSTGGAEQWQYQRAVLKLPPGTYTLIAKVTGAGNKFGESAPIRLLVEGNAQSPTTPVSTPVPVQAPQLSMTGVQLQGAATLNSPMIVFFNGQNLTPDVLVTVSNCDQPQTQLVNPAQIRHQCVPRLAGQQSAGWKANASAALVNAGSVTVAPAAPLPATITNVQPEGSPTVNTPATVLFNGQNLTPDVLVTVSNCDQPQTQLMNPTQIRHQCVPRLAGQQSAGWKANASAALVNAGSVTVAPAASLPATITSVQPQGSPTVNTPATVLFNGQNLTPDVLVTVSNCDQPQTQLVNPTQIRHQCVPRLAGQQSAGWKANASAALVTAGSVTVAPAASLPATITSVQPQGSLKVNTAATLLFNGQNLTPEVRVTLANCDQPQTQLVNPTQIRHQCVPRLAGQQSAGWKVNASAPLVSAGNVLVAP